MPNSVPPHNQEFVLNARQQALLSEQRASVRDAFANLRPEPSVGDIWVSAARWASGLDEGLFAMLVILRRFTESWSSRPLFDVAPVTEDDRLATEWSLILDAFQSGVGMPVVLHVDVQSTTTSTMLSRRLGTVTTAARSDLESIVRAYAFGDSSGLDLRAGRTGSLSIRYHSDWEEFSHEIISISKLFANALAFERSSAEPKHATSVKEERDVRSVGGPGAIGKHWHYVGCWEYFEARPFVFSHCKIDYQRLGDAIAEYYHGAARFSYLAEPLPLQKETFRRLVPFLDASLTDLMEIADPVGIRMAICKSAGVSASEGPSRSDFELIVNSVQFARLVAGRRPEGQPMRMAARRSGPSER